MNIGKNPSKEAGGASPVERALDLIPFGTRRPHSSIMIREFSMRKMSIFQRRKLTDRTWNIVLSITLPVLEIVWLVFLGLGFYKLALWLIHSASYVSR